MFDITGRVRALRKEILELKTAHEIYKYNRSPEAAVYRQRREMRLQEIQMELGELRMRLNSQE